MLTTSLARRCVATTALLVLIAASSSVAGGPKYGLGAKVGYNFNPDQFVLGGEALVGSISNLVLVVPGLDLGIGDNAKVFAINVDGLVNLVRLPGSDATIYAGAGPTIAVIDPDEGDGATDAGLSLIGGLRIKSGNSGAYNLALRIGIGDIPDAKVTVGYLFGFGGGSKKEKEHTKLKDLLKN
jgi:hypothetical protein